MQLWYLGNSAELPTDFADPVEVNPASLDWLGPNVVTGQARGRFGCAFQYTELFTAIGRHLSYFPSNLKEL